VSGGHPFCRRTSTRVALLAAAFTLGCAAACTEEAFLNLTTPLGSGAIGVRDTVNVTVFNRTPYRAIFTFGFYNEVDQNSVPVFRQVADGTDGSGVLEGNSQLATQTFNCDRTLAIGSPEFITIIRRQDLDEGANENALNPGVGFSSAPIGDPLGTLPTEGSADGLNILQGAEFPCDSEVLIFLEEDPSTASGFRIAFEVVSPG
jgi:hypothetical protein